MLIITIDMDDIIMKPHSLILISKYLGVLSEVKESLDKYKQGKKSYKSHMETLYRIFSKLSYEDKLKAVKKVSNAIPEESRRFIDRLKKIGKVTLVSNNDHDLVEVISDKLRVKFIAENKYIFEFRCYTNRKSKLLKESNIIPDVAMTDDPINEIDFLDHATKLSIVMPKKKLSVKMPAKYAVVNSLDEAHKKIESYTGSNPTKA